MTLAEVKLWGTTIGAVMTEEVTGGVHQSAIFEYASDFLQSGIQVSPLVMPLAKEIYSFPELSWQSFHGLPGLLADSLPDRFGNALIDSWLAQQGRTPDSFNAVERLCYTGSRGMGALEFFPTQGPEPTKAKSLQVDQLVRLASEILTHQNNLQADWSPGQDDNATGMADILRIGTSAGGARAKAIIAWNPRTNEIRSGQTTLDKNFEHWLLKFDGVANNRDKELNDPKGYGAIEYAYSKMATDCGITMSDCRLLEEGDRRHFMTRRFDRIHGADKLHMQTLGALAHLDFCQPGAHSYEQAFDAMRRLGLSADATSELFRRMVFNVIARNQDDHVKNIAFLMDRKGTWSLAPAYDITYSYQPKGQWTSMHQMSINGKQDHFTLSDFVQCGKAAFLKHGEAKTILRQVQEVISHWRDYAEAVGVNVEQRDKIQSTLRLTIPA